MSSRLRDEAAEKRKTREAAAVGAVWAVLGAGFCILALGAAIFRTDVVRILPATAGAYAFIRMPVNPTGLAIEAVRGGPGLLNGHAALTVSGVERNVETHPRDAAPLRISLLDKGGHKLTGQVASPPASGPIQPGETRPFTRPVQRRAPPSPSPKPPALPAAALKLRGAAQPPSVPALQAKDAAPLPASSPYALPASAASPHG